MSTNQQDCNGNLVQTEKKPFVDPKCDPTKKAEISIKQLRIAIKDCKLPSSHDEYLRKWLLVNGFDVARAEKMLRQSLEWRRVNEVDTIFERYTPSQVFMKYFAIGQIGIDKFGCPVFVQCCGRTDSKGFSLSSTKKEFYNYCIWMLESYVKATKVETEKTGKLVTQTSYIFDYEGFSMREIANKSNLDMALNVTRFLFLHYPDSSRRLFIINAPSFFPLIMRLIKPFLHECDGPKIKVFGSDKKEWTSALLEEIEADQLPAFYGGTMTDPDGDPKCPSKLNMGGKIPSSYYLSNNPPVAKDYMETMSIGAGGRKKLKYDVDVVRSNLKWEFMTEGGDIKFGLSIKHAKITNDLVALSHVDSHLIMEEGEIVCEQPGKYVFEFDNTFSYLRSKKLRYHILIEAPSSSNVIEL
ncbi:SEC14-like protein 2 isoform X2 [Daphnia pulicaria]|nr:SEC14-like protein 2 isoform X2 [Daphnia pulicaria]